MASACVNNSIGVSPPSYAWLTPTPRLSLSRDDDPSSKKKHQQQPPSSAPQDDDQLDGSDPVDFEFRLEDPVAMLPADELFSDGKLMPLHFSTLKQSSSSSSSSSAVRSAVDESAKSCDISGMDPYLFSPKAPRCSSRWRELLGFKKLYQNSKSEQTNLKTTSSSSASNPAKSSLKHFLHRTSKSSSSSCYYTLESSLSLPLLKDSDSESVSISSSRLSLSSSSSGHEHEDLPRLSLDSDKPATLNPNPFANPPRMRIVKPRGDAATSNQSGGSSRVGRSPMRRETTTAAASSSSSSTTSRGVSVDSPRMNSSGKIIFQSLERSSSSPSSFNGGPRLKHRGMERSYSANVRVAPVLNVPVCSLRGSSKSGSVFGFGQLFSSSPQKTGHHHHHGARQQQQSNKQQQQRQQQ